MRIEPPGLLLAVFRSVAAGVLAAAAAVFLAYWLGRSQPLGGWFFFDLATIWFWQLYLSAACVCAGYLVVNRLLKAGAPVPQGTG